MRHAISGNSLNRYSSWRQATLRDIAKATLLRQRISTTEAKAKEARKLVDKLITLGKKGTLAHKRRAFAILCDHKLVSDLFNTIAVRFANRQGGYTRILRIGVNRRGDNAKMVILELTEKAPEKKKAPKKTAARSTAEKSTAAASAKGKPVENADIVEATPVKKAPARKKAEAKEPEAAPKKPAKTSVGGGIKKIFSRKKAEE